MKKYRIYVFSTYYECWELIDRKASEWRCIKTNARKGGRLFHSAFNTVPIDEFIKCGGVDAAEANSIDELFILCPQSWL